MHQPEVPAWKRLGLKLKYANERPHPESNGSSAQKYEIGANPAKEQPSNSAEPPRKKQKTGGSTKTSGDSKSKEHALSSTNGTSDGGRSSTKLKKRVSFSADTKPSSETTIPTGLQNGHGTEEAPTPAKKPKKSKKPSGNSAQLPMAPKPNAALEYLNEYHTARNTWKFNKNRETWILKHAFSVDELPREHDFALARYLHGLQGAGARDRLKMQCLELLKKEDDLGTEISGDADGDYRQRFKDDLEKSADSSLGIQKGEDTDAEYHAWIQRIPRPRLLLWSLGLDVEAPNKVNGSRPKKRKNRTAVVEYDSSSSSDSSSDSDDEDEVDRGSKSVEVNGGRIEEETSSSGSDDDDGEDDGEDDSDDSDDNDDSETV